jgi:hypothetical protein
MDVKDWTAGELADALDRMRNHPHLTGGLSMLDEATLAFGDKYPEVGEAQRVFATARIAHMRSYSRDTGQYSDEAWAEAMRAARRLAAALRPHGDETIARCKATTGWGTCNLPLDDDGTCRRADQHIGEPES